MTVAAATLILPRTPGVIMLAHDLRIMISLLIRVVKGLSKH
jgi:hypothetical protein